VHAPADPQPALGAWRGPDNYSPRSSESPIVDRFLERHPQPIAAELQQDVRDRGLEHAEPAGIVAALDGDRPRRVSGQRESAIPR
jgi:hypothetical protein